jgi:CheY-like chemotaxis protein
MKNMDGIELRDLIRDGNRNIPIILMTGERDHNLQNGFDGFLQKPFTMAELVSEVDRVRSSIRDQTVRN